MTDPHEEASKGQEAPDVTFSLGGLLGGGTPGAAGPSADAGAGAGAAPTPQAGAEAPLDISLVDEEVPGESTPAPQAAAEEPSSIEQQATQLAHTIARELAVAGPEGWKRLEAYFAITVAGGVTYTLYYDDADRVARREPSSEIIDLVQMQREVSAQLGDGPWWRMEIRLDVTGHVEADYDYGDEPFPEDQMLVPDAYLADLQAFPRERVPVWLAAYVGHDNRQWRSPQQAAQNTRAEQEAGVVPVPSYDDFPVLPVFWSRWATIAAAFVAIGSDWGPRVLPALGVFEGSSRSGSTLYILPGGRAVLSGGVWDAPALDAAYNDGEPMPDLYSGAPEWVANQVLNPRAARGLMSFCYWWDRDGWYRGESPTSDRISAAIPGVWSADTVADVVCGVVSNDPSSAQRAAAVNLVAAAEAGVVTRETLTALFDDPADDIDGALYQLSLAGLVTDDPVALSQDRAIALVREHILSLDIDTTNYPVEDLVAERLNVGWMVFVPVPEGEIAIGRAIFYIADDGVIEQSSSSTAPSVYATGFEERFNQRQTGAAADLRI